MNSCLDSGPYPSVRKYCKISKQQQCPDVQHCPSQEPRLRHTQVGWMKVQTGRVCSFLTHYIGTMWQPGVQLPHRSQFSRASTWDQVCLQGLLWSLCWDCLKERPRGYLPLGPGKHPPFSVYCPFSKLWHSRKCSDRKNTPWL